MKILNLTPHTVNLTTPAGVVTLAPSGAPVRVSMETREIGTLGPICPAGSACAGCPAFLPDGEGMPWCHNELRGVVQTPGQLEGLPESRPGVALVVSALAAQAAWAQGRADVYHPGELVRDAQGRVTGAKALVGNPDLAK